jgi:hypothetical protein
MISIGAGLACAMDQEPPLDDGRAIPIRSGRAPQSDLAEPVPRRWAVERTRAVKQPCRAGPPPGYGRSTGDTHD